jgi:Sec-independent protein translocase protein TatA
MGVAVFKMRKGIKELKKRMEEQQNTQFQGFNQPNESHSYEKTQSTNKAGKTKQEDYLDFEEIKE